MTPLSTIVTSLELADRLGVMDAPTLRLMRNEADRLLILVDDLLLLARADELGSAPRRAEVDLDEVLDEELCRLRGRCGPTVDVRVKPVRVLGDRSQLVRLVRNLTDNAHRHARERVRITLERDGADAMLSVSDDGTGIAPADRRLPAHDDEGVPLSTAQSPSPSRYPTPRTVSMVTRPNGRSILRRR